MPELELLSVGNPNALATKNGEVSKFESLLALAGVKVDDTLDRLSAWKRHIEELRPIYLEHYGVETLSDTDISVISQNEAEQELCRNCKGECPKERNAYVKPNMEFYDGILYTTLTECRYGLQRRLKKQCRLASVPMKYAGKRFADYEVTQDNRDAVQMARWYASQKPKRSLYFYGECGTGKTFLASLIAQEFLRDYQTVIFGDVPELLAEIKRTFDNKGESAQEVLDRYYTCDLLILDDIGAGKITDWVVAQLYEIINHRYNLSKRLIVTSNLDLEELKKRLATADGFSAKRITSRLSEMCEEAYFGENDRRHLK